MTRQLAYTLGLSNVPVPPQAAQVGFDTKTFDSTTLSNEPGGIYYPAEFYGWMGGSASQNADGSMTINGGSEGSACTARRNLQSKLGFSGIAFGKGGYFETIAAWDPGTGKPGANWPAIWFNDAETMAHDKVWGGNIWPGLTATVTAGSPDIVLNFPPTNYDPGKRIIFGGKLGGITGIEIGETYRVVHIGTNSIQVSMNTVDALPITPGGSGSTTLSVAYGNWIEIDCEYDSGSTLKAGYALHAWNGYMADRTQAHTKWPPATVITAGHSFADQNKFGMLWVPATTIAQGSVSFYFNDVVTYTAAYNKYDATLLPPPLLGSSAFSVIDERHLIPIIDTSAEYPMTVSSVKVWQADASGNLVNL